jgi:ATP-dependent DNA helicase RecQ
MEPARGPSTEIGTIPSWPKPAGAFGVRYLFPYQRLVAANILDALAEPEGETPPPDGPGGTEAPGGNGEPLRQIVLLPTGYGKSLCFQLPARLIPGPTLVVYPLRSLMTDQERRMRKSGIPCAQLCGGMEPQERKDLFDRLRSGAVRIVLTNPEMLATSAALGALREIGVLHL